MPCDHPAVAESRAVADRAEEILPGVWYWGVRDERIGGSCGTSHAADGVLIDPHRLAADALESLGEIRAIVLTTTVHQRSSWRLTWRWGGACSSWESFPWLAPALSRG